MYYVEYLFARSRIVWYTAILLAIGVVYLTVINNPPRGSSIHVNGNDVLIDGVFLGASWGAVIMASMLSSTLNRDHSHLAYIWTRPIPRERVALTYMLIDVFTILLAYGIALGVAVLVLAYPPRNQLTMDAMTGAMLARSVAVPLMFYGLAEIITSWSPLSRVGIAMGVLWGGGWIFIILGAIGFAPPIAQILSFINLFNPIAYFPEIHHGNINIQIAGGTPQMSPIGFAAQTFLAYAIFVVGCAVAIYNWKRMEA